MRGKFFVLEGMDGTGKTTQAQILCQALERIGRSVLHLREPGTTDAGERLRAQLLAPERKSWQPRTESLVFFAARNELLQTQILPALAAGTDVVCERFTPSTLAYQAQEQRDVSFVLALDDLVVESDSQPDCVLILECSLKITARRMAAREGVADAFEQRDHGFHEQVRAGYQHYAEARPDTACLILADGSPEEVAARIWHQLQQRKHL